VSRVEAVRRRNGVGLGQQEPSGLWRRFKAGLMAKLENERFVAAYNRFLDRLTGLLSLPTPDRATLLWRIGFMERNVILPIKAAGIAMVLHSFYFSPWIGIVLGELEIAVESTQYFLWIYIGLNLVAAGLLLGLRRLPVPVTEWTVFTISLADGIFLAALTLVTGGCDSILYWIFLGLIIRTSFSVPRATSQLILNLTLTACYVLAGAIDISIAENLDEASRLLMERPANPTETLVLRMMLLVLMTLCCYAVQVLLERQRRAEDEAREFAFREGQLHSAGRLAAEFAHQIKNPLAIINNGVFSLKRALREGKAEAIDQLQMIQEEVMRADQIITQVMGYAQLSEGRVERLDVIEQIERALAEVFPPTARYPVEIQRHYSPNFPPLLMQRRHVSEIFVNLLQNARDALGERGGNVIVTALRRGDDSTEVAIADNGPGIPPEKHERIFEAYYSTKEKGTGLGLAMVKHNAELYGGSIRVESGLGKGARFVLVFPARILIRPHT
jgi:signal transduction histidine kinase